MILQNESRMTRESGDLEATKAMLGAGVGSALMPDGNALGLHFVMFVPTIMGQVRIKFLQHKNV